MSKLVEYKGLIRITPKTKRVILEDEPGKPTVSEKVGEPYGRMAEALILRMLGE